MRQRHRVGHVDATLILLLERDIGWFFVESDAKSFQFGLDYSLMCEGLIDI